MTVQPLKDLAGFQIPDKNGRVTASAHNPSIVILETQDAGSMARICPDAFARSDVPDLDGGIPTTADNLVAVKLDTVDPFGMSWKLSCRMYSLRPILFQQLALHTQVLPVDRRATRNGVSMGLKDLGGEDL